MSNIKDLIKELCPNGVEYKKLDDCCKILDNKRKPVKKGERSIGEYPYYGANGIQDYVSDYIFDGTFVLVGEDGSVQTDNGTPVVNWAIGKIWVNNHAHIIEEIDGVSLRYLYHYLQIVDVKDLIHGNIPKLNQGDFRNIKIAIPPMEIQEEIVKILDKFSELEAELEAELESRKSQYEFWREKLINNDNNVVELGDVCKIVGRIGFRGYTRNDLVNSKEDGAISLSPGNIKNNNLNYDDPTYVSWEKYEESPEIMVDNNDIIFCKTGSTVGKVALVQDLPHKATINPQLVVLKELKCNPSYLAYLMESNFFQSEVMRIKGLGSIPTISQKDLAKLKISLPSRTEQDKIAIILDKFNALINDMVVGIPAEIELRRQQYEYYRNKLLSFEGMSCE